MKKTAILALMSVLCLSILYGCSDTNRQADPISDFTYRQNEDGNIIIEDYLGDKTKVVVPEKINGRKVVEIGSFAFGEDEKNMVYGPQITYIDIPKTVKVIGEYAFDDCRKLKTVIIPEGVEIIGSGAFGGCIELESIEIPKTVKEIRDKAFFECESFKKAYMSASVKYGEFVFSYSSVESVEIEEGVTVIPAGTFSNTKIKDVTLPKSVEIIEPSAFYGCDELISVNLTQGLKEICQSVFVRCSKLTEIIIPETVTELGEDAFWECENLKGVKFEGKAPVLSEAQLNEDSKTYYTVYYHEGVEGFTLPEWCGYPCKTW
ncbi:MAG: leucine-rich repeat domain-containing protein [Clostridia bacterium]|nr:leucine-rich repeat domain-containing protein [Clostridia bacterium]